MNRNVLSLLVFLSIGSAAIAQTGKGSWMVGGNLNLNTAKNNTEISFMPSAGYFFFRNFVAGLNTTVSYTKDVSIKTTSLGAGPFARYYLGTMNVRPFGDAELSFESMKTTTDNTSNTYNSTSFFLGGGLAAFINRNVAIEGIAGYKHTSFEGGLGTSGFNFRVGFQVYLSRHQVEALSR